MRNSELRDKRGLLLGNLEVIELGEIQTARARHARLADPDIALTLTEALSKAAPPLHHSPWITGRSVSESRLRVTRSPLTVFTSTG